MRHQGQSTARTRLSFAQADLEAVFQPPIGFTLSLTALAEAGATGLAGGSGADQLRNSGSLATEAIMEAGRGNLSFTLVEVGDVPQTLTGRALAVGVDGATGDDRLTNEATGTLDVSSTATTVSVGITAEGLRLPSVSNAVFADAVATGMSGSSGRNMVDNAGSLAVDATASLVDTAVAVKMVAAAALSALFSDPAAASSAAADATGLVGGAGRDQLRSTGALDVKATADHTAAGVTVGDASLGGNIVDVFVSPPEFPDAIESGALASARGLGADLDSSSTGADSLVAAGRLDVAADAAMTSVDIFVAAPIGQVSGFAGTRAGQGIGRITDAFSLALTDVSSDAGAFAAGLAGAEGGDWLELGGAARIAATARAETRQYSLDVASLFEGDSKADASPLTISFNVFTTGSNALARSTGLAGHGGADLFLLRDGSAIDVMADATAISGSGVVAVKASKNSLNAQAAIAFNRTWAVAEAAGIEAGRTLAGDDGGAAFSGSGGQVKIAGRLGVAARTNAERVGVSADFTAQRPDRGGGGALLSFNMIDTALYSEAFAAGARGFDQLRLEGTLHAAADAFARGTTVSASMSMDLTGGIAGNASYIAGDQLARAAAVGLSRADRSGDGLLLLQPGASLTAEAVSRSERVDVSANVAVTPKVFRLQPPSSTSAIGARRPRSASTCAKAPSSSTPTRRSPPPRVPTWCNREPRSMSRWGSWAWPCPPAWC